MKQMSILFLTFLLFSIVSIFSLQGMKLEVREGTVKGRILGVTSYRDQKGHSTGLSVLSYNSIKGLY